MIEGLNTGEESNIDGSLDPLFTDFDNAVYTLKRESLCVDAGNDALFDTTVGNVDLTGAQRIRGRAIDLGAYESNFDTDWLGIDDSLWSNEANWSNGVPDAKSNVVLSAGAIYYPTLNDQEQPTVNTLTFAYGYAAQGYEYNQHEAWGRRKQHLPFLLFL